MSGAMKAMGAVRSLGQQAVRGAQGLQARGMGARNGSSWAHNDMHGKRCFDAKIQKIERAAKKAGLEHLVARKVKPESDMSNLEVASVCGSMALVLSGATAYLAS
mmetsp:Transcript_12914/g.20285  ORF Transcript_12914/g.20285 Transcript_12914/m.20285 type:complete len:105 (+) Transcript_12914:478-792(+)|eukprot:CAMPEP_0184309800 /NCGR_PEP_ID=MMETSP1049-20130417/19454_1 /TAXON_ID=77928 /ORGANISM="Proteomonas sulcata, Strain CCMP704" /LENGTH=104 /DNA_ID=CAMNT_0026622823 /DNA_START=447 /DNA_END=761 /DNA_ORIENTATION=+